jgi:hypothetical protein
MSLLLPQDMKISVLITLLADMFEIYPIYVDMEDVGHSGVSRRRGYTIVVLREEVDVIRNPVEMYQELVGHLKSLSQSWGGGTVPSDYLTADSTEIQLDALESSRFLDQL